MDETIYVILKVMFDFALEVWFSIHRPLAEYGLSAQMQSRMSTRGSFRGNFEDHVFLNAQCLASILIMAALSCNSLLHTLPYKIFDN